MKNELKPFWRLYVDCNWKLGIFLLLAICIPSFVLVLQASRSGNYGLIAIIMVLSALIPFILLSKQGRFVVGCRSPNQYRWLFIALIAGLLCSVSLYIIGAGLYGDSDSNWYHYIGRSYRIPADISEKDKAIMFTIMAITGMSFSPIGEELFFRGIVHQCFAKSIGKRKATLTDSAVFALVHLAHFGIVFVANRWHLLLFPALIWLISMFLITLLFSKLRDWSGSIFTAITCHAAFNLGMIYCIFYGFS